MLKGIAMIIFCSIISFSCKNIYAQENDKESGREKELQEIQELFKWWPSDAKPVPIKDAEREGYWWWPTTPGKMRPWGNRGYVYVYKIIFDYKEEELPQPKPHESRPSLLIKKIIKNIKIYFPYDKASLRDDAIKILKKAVSTLRRSPETSILITGNCDRRGSEAYNEKLGRRRAEAVMKFMLNSGIAAERIRIISRGKLDAVAPLIDLVGMQKDRNAQFMIAEVEEVMLPYPGEEKVPKAKKIGEGKFIVEEEEKIESEIKITTKEYIIQKGDTLWGIAQKELGSGHRWKYLYELNKDKIKKPNKLKTGQKIIVPIE